ncbi:N-acetyltransferase [Salipiger marinus]|uniref:N-acetyltransferase n=1 Tax=Salipiger marinus TaxID=555512 RepID=UPI00405A2291
MSEGAGRPEGRAGQGPDAASNDQVLQLDSFEVQVVPITQQLRPFLHELTVSVRWPHRDSDLDFLIGQGEGYLALDEIGRPVGSAMHFPMGKDFALLGMMVTPPRLQARGGGRFLLRTIMRDCAGRDMRLNATRSGYRLYREEGFLDVGKVWQHQGLVGDVPVPDPLPGVEIRQITPQDRAAIEAMDAHAYGADRGPILAALMQAGHGLIALCAGQPCGFALVRQFGKGQVIGPLVAEDERMAVAMTARLLDGARGSFMRMDTPFPGTGLRAFLTASGMTQFDTVTEMRVGPQRLAETGLVTFALAAHSLG